MQAKLKKQGEKISKWFNTEEGHANLMKGIKEARKTRTKHYIDLINKMTESEFLEFAKTHKRSRLLKFRGKSLNDFDFD